MGRRHRQSLLTQQIADILLRKSGRSLIYTGSAIAALVPLQAGAVTLGDITIESALGQPFQATVPVRTTQGEWLRPNCISATGNQNSGLNKLQKPTVHTPDTTNAGLHTLTITTRQPVYEPMYELQLKVKCPGAPVVMRHYVLMLDLPGLHTLQPEAQDAPQLRQRDSLNPGETSRPAEQNSMSSGFATRGARNSSERNLTPDSTGIVAGSSYRVTSGDTLSTIAKRVEGRPPGSIWWLAREIATANPHAFIRNDPNLIKLGAVIRIPAASSWASGIEPTGLSSLSGSFANSASLPSTPAPKQPVSVNPAPAITLVPEIPELVAVPETAVDSFPEQPVTALPDTPAAGFLPDIQLIPAVESDTPTMTVTSSPFLDDQLVPQPEVTVDSDKAAPIEPPEAAAVVGTTTESPASSASSPLIAIVVGILLGLVLSSLLLRDQLLSKLGFGLGRTTRAIKKAATKSLNDRDVPENTLTDLFAETEYDDAVTAEVEQPHIAAEQIHEDDRDPAETSAPLSDATLDPVFAAAVDQATMVGTINPVDSELAYLFDEDPNAADSHATATMQTPVVDIGEEFNDLASTMAQTEELPDTGDPELLAPTQELPSQASDESPMDDTSDIDLESLADSAIYDDKLSATLQQALSLLEKDYEEELTASQILTVDSAAAALKDDSLSDVLGESDPVSKRKGTG